MTQLKTQSTDGPICLSVNLYSTLKEIDLDVKQRKLDKQDQAVLADKEYTDEVL